MRDQLDLFQLALGFEAAPPIPVTHDLPADPVAFYRELIEQHHAAMMAADVDRVNNLREKAHGLASDMNGGTICGITGPNGPGLMLERETTAAPGSVPLWGQSGSFTVTVDGIPVHIELDGIFGIGCSFHFWPGFDARRVHHGQPFPISETGYRTFIGETCGAEPEANITPDAFVTRMIAAYLANLKPKSRRKKRS